MKQLDALLQPYVDAVEIAKAKTEELLEPLETAEEALEKRLNKTVKAFRNPGQCADLCLPSHHSACGPACNHAAAAPFELEVAAACGFRNKRHYIVWFFVSVNRQTETNH